MADKYLNLEGLTEVAGYVNKKLRTVTVMPSAPTLNDIVLYNGATSAKYEQGSIYLYTQVGTYYKWSDLSTNYYTLAAAPEIGDTVYSDTTGTDSGYTVTAYNSTNHQITVNSLVYDRDSTGDTNIYDWVCKSASTSGYSPSFLDTSLVFNYGALPEVDGNSIVFNFDGD